MQVTFVISLLMMGSALSSKDFKFSCKPKQGCDFSRCDPIPSYLFEMDGFDADEYRKQNRYHIECSPNFEFSSFSSCGTPTANGQKGEPGPQGPKGDPGPPGEKGDSGSRAAGLSSARLSNLEISQQQQTLALSKLQRDNLILKEELSELKKTFESMKPEIIENVNREVIKVRLVNGKTMKDGRVEIFYKGIWGTICSYQWDIKDTHVVCRMLGYTKGAKYTTYSSSTAGFGKVWLSYVGCIGTESSLADCSHPGWGENSCSHFNDVTVVCD